jgi:electron transport complex protein RnfA
MEIKALLSILLMGIFVNNYVLQKFLGICPFLGVSKKFNQASGMGVAVIFVMLCATAVTWPIQKLVLEKFNLEYLQTIVFILVIAALVQFVEIVLKKFIPALYKSLGVYLPLITTNCAVLGIAIDNFSYEYVQNFTHAMFSSLGVGIGFLFAMVLFAGVRSKVDNCDAPKAIKGLPATLIAASIVSLAFYGFAGVIDGLLGM